MNQELAGLVDGVPERFVPGVMEGELVEAEHLSRYWWVSPLVRGLRVLDAGCGVAYGAAMLAEAGAREVVGVDIAEDVIEAARRDMPSQVQLQVGDVRGLDTPSGSFDVVVCFEVLEHLDDPEEALSELARVLSDEGFLATSSPNREVYVAGNPHHRHEFTPDELRDALRRRFRNVELYRQHDWLASAVLSDEPFASKVSVPLEPVAVRKVVANEPGTELYTLALAGNGKLAVPPASAVLTDPVEPRAWLERFALQSASLDEQAEMLEQQKRHLDDLGQEQRRLIAENHAQRQLLARQADEVTELSSLRGELAQVSERLLEAERLVADVPSLRQTAEEAAADRDRLLAEVADLEQCRIDLVEARQFIHDMERTRVWRLGQRYWRFKNFLLRTRT